MALGVDAVYIGSIAIMAAIQTQAAKTPKTLPENEPVQITIWSGKFTDKLDIDIAAKHLANFLQSCIMEMKHAVQAAGKKSFKDLNREDLVTVDIELAKLLRIAYVGDSCE